MHPVARLGDTHACPRHGTNVITSGGKGTADGRPMARVGDTCACGGVIVEGSSVSTDLGRPVAYVGCKTSCGGTITTGSPTVTVSA
ncbi:MAG: PAAR domain-containing protein [Gemmobacter sp.]